MIKPILNYNNKEDRKILSSISKPVEDITTKEIKQIIQDLKDTLAAASAGKGLSAIQIGVPKCICVCSWADQTVIMINPVITRSRGCQKYLEGCLSVPGRYEEIERAQKVWCTYTDENGDIKEIAEGGRMSNIIQHELDHFKGICKLYNES